MSNRHKFKEKSKPKEKDNDKPYIKPNSHEEIKMDRRYIIQSLKRNATSKICRNPEVPCGAVMDIKAIECPHCDFVMEN